MSLAKKSLKNLYKVYFGENSLNDTEKEYTRDELILKYGKNLMFWNIHLPDVKPNMTEFTNAKHFISSNAIEQLWKKCDEYNIRNEVELYIKVSLETETKISVEF